MPLAMARSIDRQTWMGVMSSEELSGDERRGGVPRALTRPVNGGREELAVAGHDTTGATGGGGREARARLGVALLLLLVFSGRRGGGGDAAAARAHCEGGGGRGGLRGGRGRGLERPEVG